MLNYQRFIVVNLCVLLFAGCASGNRPAEDQMTADYREYSIESLQVLMERGDLSSEQLTRYYLDRIEYIDRAGPELNSIIEINPQALEIAAALDAERAATGPRGPMHGIPVILKANIDTAATAVVRNSELLNCLNFIRYFSFQIT